MSSEGSSPRSSIQGVSSARVSATTPSRSTRGQSRRPGRGSRRARVNSWLTTRARRSTPPIRNCSALSRSAALAALRAFCACRRRTAKGVRISWAASAMKRCSRRNRSSICPSRRLIAACIGSSSFGSGTSCSGSSDSAWRARITLAMFCSGRSPQPMAAHTSKARARLPNRNGISVCRTMRSIRSSRTSLRSPTQITQCFSGTGKTKLRQRRPSTTTSANPGARGGCPSCGALGVCTSNPSSSAHTWKASLLS
ncbi:hypothetical protein D9M71_448130 [compost metagenome]